MANQGGQREARGKPEGSRGAGRGVRLGVRYGGSPDTRIVAWSTMMGKTQGKPPRSAVGTLFTHYNGQGTGHMSHMQMNISWVVWLRSNVEI